MWAWIIKSLSLKSHMNNINLRGRLHYWCMCETVSMSGHDHSTWSHVSAMCQRAVCTCFIPPRASDWNKRHLESTANRTQVGCSIMSAPNKQTSGCNGYLPRFVQAGSQTCTCGEPPRPRPSRQQAPDGRQGRGARETCDPELQPSMKTLQREVFLSTYSTAGTKCAPWSHALHIQSDKCIKYIHYPQAAGLSRDSKRWSLKWSSVLQARLKKLIVQEIDDPSCRISCLYAFYSDLITELCIRLHVSVHIPAEAIW